MPIELKRFPFIIKSKHVIVHASGFKNALDRALAKYPNKYIKTKHAKNMDLINAQKQAKESSKFKKGQLFYVILEQDEFLVKDFMEVKESDDVYSIWRDGTKIDSPNGQKENNNQEQKTENKMENKKEKLVKKAVAPKSTPAKAAKVAPAKKAAKVAKKKAKKVPIGNGHVIEAGGKKVDVSPKQMLNNIKKGVYYRNWQGVRITEKHLKSRANQDYVLEGIFEYKVKQK